MKSFRDTGTRLGCIFNLLILAAALCAGASQLLRHPLGVRFAATHNFARWIENVEGGSDVEKALYRLMQLPGGEILFRRPPRETVPALTALQQTQKSAALYSQRALEEEQALDFDAAERDWKIYAQEADDRTAASLDLADFYERRLKPQDELAALEVVGEAPARADERWTAVESQYSWLAWERALKVIDEYALPRAATTQIYDGWIVRYPRERSLYERQFAFQLAGSDFAAASNLIARYRTAFSDDKIFPVQAEAQLAAKRGSPKDGLAVYERAFEPLWPAELVRSYFALVLSSKNERQFADELRAKMAANPDDLRDAAQLFYLEQQQQGHADSAKAVLINYREQKDSRGATWSATELDTLARLFESVQDYPEAARYNYALAADHSTAGAEQNGVVGLARILLAAPDQPVRVGAGNLQLYQSIATMDRGPGYLNGILSLFLNTQGPDYQYANEDRQALPYFHRAKAAELVAEIDRRFPNAPERAQLHASMMDAYAAYGQDDAVIREGTGVLASFPNFEGRVRVAMQVADAYARTNQTEKEFALYQSLLKELAARADGVPLGDSTVKFTGPIASRPLPTPPPPGFRGDLPPEAGEPEPAADNGARSAEYAQVLDRYLSRLVSLRRLPDALDVLRGELDRNPQDPGLYERLADFLAQNSLNAREEEVYQRAIDQFKDEGWYARLARFYLRQRRNADYDALMRKVAGIFSGTELEEFLMQAPAPGRALALQVDLYAHQRFPHDLRFVNDLLNQYTAARRDADVERLLWDHWSESPALRDRLFELLSRNGRLDQQLALLRQQSPEIEKSDWAGLATRNPAAERFWMEACLWQSHFEQSVGAADALAQAYPADATLGDRASSLYRSLAYFHPEDTDKAVAIEKQQLAAQPANLDVMARIGGTYADRERFADAAPYWVQMAQVHPGDRDGYLQAATVFWDYYDFSSAMVELNKARDQFKNPTLYGYQAGAVEESRGDLPAAVREYVASALSSEQDSQSLARLTTLAHREPVRATIEGATANLLKQPSPSASAIDLRATILVAERRRDDLARELSQLVAQTASFDVLDAVTQSARVNALHDVEEAALRRQVALTTDPVRNLQLRYQLADLLQKRNPQAAAAEIDAIYHEHDKILGVVRSTVDYDWIHDRKPQAVSVLLDAAQASYPNLKSSFQLEAAQKLTDIGEFPHSRAILESLLTANPLDSGSESALAENYARSNDQVGLEAFYRSRLALVQQAQLDPTDKRSRIAQLRRGIVAAASLLGNTSEAVDQYIELINAFPDDAGLAQEASLYAVAHNSRDRFFTFYQKTITASPRDPRWSLVLARLATAAEDYPLAIDAYSATIKLRPERQDLYMAQADLDERLHRFDDAVTDYGKLYTLSYRDPEWMEKIAELRARQGRAADAVKALDTAWIEGKPQKAANSFQVAARLESWGLLDEARRYAEQGINQAGADLLIESAGQTGAATYARILARQRQAPQAYARLATARQQAANVPLVLVAQQVVRSGPGAVSSEEWRHQLQLNRAAVATRGFAAALNAMGGAAGEFYTPEEKEQFAAWLQSVCASSSPAEMRTIYLPAAQTANLTDLASGWMWNLAWNGSQLNAGDLSAWTQLEDQRGLMDEVASHLENIAPGVNVRQRAMVWQYAADARHKFGDAQGELRDLQQLAMIAALGGDQQTRYYRLLWNQQPQQLAALATTEDAAAQFILRNSRVDQAIAAIASRSSGRPPVWKSAYTGLAGLYLHDQEPDVRDGFSNALGTGLTIGERVAHPADRDRQLAGEIWFYYGSRYGEFLDDFKDPNAEDFLESELEHTPESSAVYLQLADYSAQAGRTDLAIADYQRSLELHPDQPATLARIGVVDWKANRHADAQAAWNEAVKRLAVEMDERQVPETFWTDFPLVLSDVGTAGQYDSIRLQIDAMLHTYVARNGYFRAEPLIAAAYRANGESAQWLLDITAAAVDQRGFLENLLASMIDDNGSGWIRRDQRSLLLARVVELEEKDAQQNPAEESESLFSVRQQLVAALVEEKKFVEAGAILAQIPLERRNRAEWLPSVLAVAEAGGKLDSLLAQWQKQPGAAPTSTDLRSAAVTLDENAKRSVMQFVYERALDARDLTAPNFLGLAAVRLDRGDTAGAIDLLKRMVLVSTNMYADTDSAAQLLQQRHKNAEAIPFLQSLADGSPWNARYKVRLATAMLAAGQAIPTAVSSFAAVAADQKATYADRVAAARALKGHAAQVSGSAELQLLAQDACPLADAANKRFFVAARESAAACAANHVTSERLLQAAVAIAPSDMQLRLLYIWSAFAAGSDIQAVNAAQPILQGWNGVGSSVEAAPMYAHPEAENSPPGYGNEDESQGQPPSILAAMSQADAARFFALVIHAEERQRELDQAAAIAQTAIGTLRDPALRKTFVDEAKRINDELAREHENDARMPTIHTELAQDHVVRERLEIGPFTPMPVPAQEARP